MQWSDVLEFLEPELWQRYQLLLRLLLAAALGGMIGLEREHSGKPAGFRTNMLICLGAALITEVSFNVAHTASGDPGRIAAQIVSGIGFLGAGTILHSRGSVYGLTTAATLWVVAAIGMAVGARSYLAAVIGTSLVMLALMILGRVEDHLIPRKPSDRHLEVTTAPDGSIISSIEDALRKAGFSLDTIKVEKNHEQYFATFHARGVAQHWEGALKNVLAIDGVVKVELT
ncbi:MAG TPA: MgtC/SapB family protein [Longimicrobiales bacterium]